MRNIILSIVTEHDYKDNGWYLIYIYSIISIILFCSRCSILNDMLKQLYHPLRNKNTVYVNNTI